MNGEGDAQHFLGLAVCSGVVLAPVVLLDRRRVAVPHYSIDADAVDAELLRLSHAIALADEDLLNVARSVNEDDDSTAIVDALRLLVNDSGLRRQSEALIREEGVNAEWAVHRATRGYQDLLERHADTYLRERRRDIGFVADRIIRALLKEHEDLRSDVSGRVVVAFELSPTQVVELKRRGALAVITERGGRTSHAAIIARALQLCAIFGAEGAFQWCPSEGEILVDGRSGDIWLSPTDALVARRRDREARIAAIEALAVERRDLEAKTIDGEVFVVKAALELREDIECLPTSGADGVGLFRTEFLMSSADEAQRVEKHREIYARLCSKSVGPPTIRLFDLGSDKPTFDTQSSGMQSALGLRGIRYLLERQELLRAQLKGLAEVAKTEPLKILLPMVTDQQDINALMVHFDEIFGAKEEYVGLKLGAMVEVPAMMLLVDHILDRVDFVSVGSNDLVQYLLAAGRAHPSRRRENSWLHPAVLKSLHFVAERCRAYGVDFEVCGDMVCDPQALAALVALRADALNAEVRQVAQVKEGIRHSDFKQCQVFLESALKAATASEVLDIYIEVFEHAHLA